MIGSKTVLGIKLSMLPYWTLFFLPLLSPLFGGQRFSAGVIRFVWVLCIAYMVVFIGLRHEVGADWDAYLELYHQAESMPFEDSLALSDPGYMLLNEFSASINGEIYVVNSAVALLAVAGLVRLASSQPYPWLSLLSAIPYLVVVVFNGLTRQSAAIGLVCFALTEIASCHGKRAIVLILIAMLFHKTAAFVLPLLVFAIPQGGTTRRTIGLALASAIVCLCLIRIYPALFELYILDESHESSGGLVRVLLTALPGAALLVFRRHLLYPFPGRNLWTACAAISLLALVFVSSYSTMVDRLMLYLAPMTMVFFGRIPVLFSSRSWQASAVVVIIALQAAVLWIWLNYAAYRENWIPYRMFPFI